MSVKRTIRLDDYLNSQFEDYLDLLKSIFGKDVVINNVICGLLLKGMISDIEQLSILFSDDSSFSNDYDKNRIDSIKSKYESILKNLELYQISK